MCHIDNRKRVVAIFAHNEARNILSCLESVWQAIRDGDEVYVLNNGSTDHTGDIVSRFSEQHSFCNLITIGLGDKANAWNVFSHELGVSASLYIFMDGDCTVSRHSFDALELGVENNPGVNAAAGVPEGSVSRKNREAMLRDGGLAGNLYALSPDFMIRIRTNGVYLPVGLIGDDSLLGALAYWNLNPQARWNKENIVMCEDATFSYKRLSCLLLSDIRLYWRRRIRYSLRYYQTKLMRPSLKSSGLKGIPRHIEEIYVKSASQLKLEWRGLDTWFDYLALRIIKNNITD